ncbi:class I SAM-dependent methyltransferase [Chitinophaga lutea]|nr:class I SAM-dependent methyltransferase [Chitinophaga lutea]
MHSIQALKTVDRDIYSSLENPKGARYDNKAKYYERVVGTRLFNRLFWGTLPSDYTNFARNAIVDTKGSVLDVGCGGLTQTASLYKTTTNECVLADRSVEMLKIARSRLMDNDGSIPSNIRLLQTDAFHLPFPHNTFDTVCSFGTIHLFDNKQEFVDGLLRVLKSGGKFYFLSMTTEKLIARLFMAQLRPFKEFGQLFSAGQTLSLFDSDRLEVKSYMKGSVIFIYGQKL